MEIKSFGTFSVRRLSWEYSLRAKIFLTPSKHQCLVVIYTKNEQNRYCDFLFNVSDERN